MRKLVVIALLCMLPACSISTEKLQAGLDAVETRLEQTKVLLVQADQTLATTQFALQEAMDQGFGPEAIARAQNAVFRAESVVNDIKNTLTTLETEKGKWQGALDTAEASGAGALDFSSWGSLLVTSIGSIMASVKTTSFLRDRARVARGEVVGTQKVGSV